MANPSCTSSGGVNGKLVLKLLPFRMDCYQVTFSFLVENRSRVGDMLITQHGELKQLRVAEGGMEGMAQVWKGIGKVRLVWGGENVREDWTELPPALSAPEPFLLAVRWRKLNPRYFEELNLLSLPIPRVVPASATVVGGQRVEVGAGGFDCWVLALEGWKATLWVSKKDGVVPKFVEDNLSYELSGRRFWHQ